jgi:hypothetical protein
MDNPFICYIFGIDDALIAAGVAGAASYFGGESQNDANSDMADAQMAFQERMSNTSYQRQAKDLRAAGINPINFLGGGASTPPGSMAHMVNPAAEGASSALAAYRNKAEVDNIRKAGAEIDSRTKLNTSLDTQSQFEAMLKAAQIQETRATIDEKSSSAARLRQETQNLNYIASGLKVESDIDNSNYGKLMRYIERVNPFKSGVGAILRRGK